MNESLIKNPYFFFVRENLFYTHLNANYLLKTIFVLGYGKNVFRLSKKKSSPKKKFLKNAHEVERKKEGKCLHYGIGSLSKECS